MDDWLEKPEIKLLIAHLRELKRKGRLRSLNRVAPDVAEKLRRAIEMTQPAPSSVVLDTFASANLKSERRAQADYETSAEGKEISDISGHPETEGLYTEFSQAEVPPQTSEALNIENIAQKFFGGGATPQEAQTIIQRTIWEINVLMQSLEFFSKQGVKDPQAALNLMKNKQGSIILYDPNDPYAQWHERQHALGREMSPDQFKEYIKNNLGSEMPEEAREQFAQSIMDQITGGLMGTGAYSQSDIPSELAARQKELETKYSPDVLEEMARQFMGQNPGFIDSSPS